MTDAGEPFFSKETTYEQIAMLAATGKWVVYVGLGATIDRTDVDWSRLVERLLTKAAERVGATKADAGLWLQRLGPQRAATTAETIFRHTHSDWQGAIRSEIRSALYGPRRFMAGDMLTALVSWAFAVASKGGSVFFITPNYDEYLESEIIEVSQVDDQGVRVLPLTVSTPTNWRLPSGWSDPETVGCLHIHGYVPDTPKAARGVPAVGEVTYQETSAATRKLLTTAFADSNVLVVGSSLSDGPLVDALVATARSRATRLVIQPLQGADWHDGRGGTIDGLVALNSARLEAMNLEPVRPDFYCQVAQFIYEAASTVALAARDAIGREDAPQRYSQRLDAWWRKWSRTKADQRVQRFHHEVLSTILPKVREDLGAKADEGIKIEVWARWKPTDSIKRSLRLWATSLGEAKDYRWSREGAISMLSPYVAVRVFLQGSPQLMSLSDPGASRWKSYFGFPVWKTDGRGRFVVGVVVIASLRPQEGAGADPSKPSCISEYNLARINRIRPLLDLAASLILTHKVAPRDHNALLSGLSEFLTDPDLISIDD